MSAVQFGLEAAAAIGVVIVSLIVGVVVSKAVVRYRDRLEPTENKESDGGRDEQ